MREIDFGDIENIWAGNTDPTMLYIQSPFCPRICTFCVHRGRRVDDNFDAYFNEYLPNQIDKYMPIIERQNVEEIFFGGGTANLLPDLSNLDPVFERIRHIKPAEKTIELHFNLPITDETISKIVEEGFNSVILCIQTFNQDLLARLNRNHEKCNDIDYLISKFHEAGVRVASDFIYFHEDEDGYRSFVRDMQYVASLKDPLDEITIAACYQGKDKIASDIADKFERVLAQAGFEFCEFDSKDLDSSEALANGKIKNQKYVKDWKSLYSAPIDNMTEFVRKVNQLRLFRYDSLLEKNFFVHIPYTFETQSDLPYELDPIYFSKYTSVIGIGSYLNPDKNTYSKCHSYSYNEVWDGNDVKYYLSAERSFYQKARDFLDWMEKVSDGRDPDFGTELTFKNLGHIYSRVDNVADHLLDFNLYSPHYSEYIENINAHKAELEGFYETTEGKKN